MRSGGRDSVLLRQLEEVPEEENIVPRVNGENEGGKTPTEGRKRVPPMYASHSGRVGRRVNEPLTSPPHTESFERLIIEVHTTDRKAT